MRYKDPDYANDATYMKGWRIGCAHVKQQRYSYACPKELHNTLGQLGYWDAVNNSKFHAGYYYPYY